MWMRGCGCGVFLTKTITTRTDGPQHHPMGLDGLVVIACQGDIMELGLRAGLGGDAGVAGVGLEEAEEVVGRLGSWEGSGVVSWGGTRREAVRRGSRGAARELSGLALAGPLRQALLVVAEGGLVVVEDSRDVQVQVLRQDLAFLESTQRGITRLKVELYTAAGTNLTCGKH